VIAIAFIAGGCDCWSSDITIQSIESPCGVVAFSGLHALVFGFPAPAIHWLMFNYSQSRFVYLLILTAISYGSSNILGPWRRIRSWSCIILHQKMTIANFEDSMR
jgi:hypothetical protein